MTKKDSRNWMMVVGAVLLVAAILWSFWPRPVLVDVGLVKRQAMHVTIDEEGKTRVRDAYVVSTPVAGRLLRIEVEPGDQVKNGVTVIARMLPSNPSALDIRTREQAGASVTAAEAAVRVAQADLNKAKADDEFYELTFKRVRLLRNKGTSSQAALEQSERDWRTARASFDRAQAAISMRRADLANARARLIGFDASSNNNASTDQNKSVAIPVLAPISGRILRVLQESETTLPAGKAILEIGDISKDLEIIAQLLSTDAVRVSVGNRVIINNWGGEYPLKGIVERVDPWGFTKFSALGVEEQRVNAIIKFIDPPEKRENLGHGFRVETQIVVWAKDNILIVPSSALFRKGKDWAVFVVKNGRAVETIVSIDHNSGIQAELLGGLNEGDQVILYPGSVLSDGSRVAKRHDPAQVQGGNSN